MIGSRKARLWEAYLARWRASTERHDDGLVDVFMLNFADCYDRGSDGKE
jgi:type VI secretion system protein ImpI